jgi:hypothetical protein
VSAATVRATAAGDRAAALGLRTLQAGPLLILALLSLAMAALSPFFATRANWSTSASRLRSWPCWRSASCW